MNDPLLPSRSLRVFHAVASTLWWLMVAFWLLLALAWGALHGWIVPRVHDLRPEVEMRASRALGLPVRIGEIRARSEGLVPTFELRDVQLHDPHQQEMLRLEQVVLTLSPRSLWNLGFEQIYVAGPRLALRRDAAGRFWIAGLELAPGPKGDDARVTDWLFRQKEIVVRGGELRYTDEARGDAPQVLTDVTFVSRNSLRRHALRLDATPPAAWGERFTVLGQFRQPLFSRHPGDWQAWVGQFHVDVPRVSLPALRTLLTLGGSRGVQLQAAAGGARAWLDVERGAIAGGAVDLALQPVSARLGPQLAPLSFSHLSGRVSGRRLPAGFEFETQGLQFETADGVRWPGGNAALSWRDAQGATPAQGRLHADRLDLDALGRVATRLPLPQAARDALRPGVRGLVDVLQVRWQGPLDALARYEARGRATGLALPAQGRVPGLRGGSVEFDFTEAGGKARVQLAQGAMVLPGVFEDPLIPIERFAADVGWKVEGGGRGRIAVDARHIELRNADVDASGQLAWHTGDDAATRWPGVLDLQMAVARADGTRVWRYLPLVVPREARQYVREAVIAGRVRSGQVRVRGDLREFPFAQPRSGEFRVAAQVQDAQYAFVPPYLVNASVNASANGNAGTDHPRWPVLTNLSGELVFERQGMRVQGAQARLSGGAGLQATADAAIADLHAPTVTVNAQVRGPLAESLAVFNATPAAAWIGHPLAGSTANGPAEVRLGLALPLAQIDRSRVQGSVTLLGNDVRIRPDTPAMARARGVVAFSERGFSVQGVQVRSLGGEARIDGGLRAAPGGGVLASGGDAQVTIRAQGTATADAMRQARELGTVARIAQRAQGSTGYALTLGIGSEGFDVAVASSLQGLALDLPAPLGKAADAAMPLRFELDDRPAQQQDRVALTLGSQLSVVYERDLSGREPQVLRGAIGLGLAGGESAPLPAHGVLANANLGVVNVDAWQEVLASLAPPAPGAGAAQAAPGTRAGGRSGAAASQPTDGYLPTVLALRAREISAQGRSLSNVVAGGSREGLTWRGNVHADELDGYLEYRRGGDAGEGRVLARLSRLSLAAAATREVETLLDAPAAGGAASIPALDVQVDDFELRGKHLGRLEIEAVNRGPEWRLNRLGLSMPEASFSASGNWATLGGQAPRVGRGAERRRTVMNFRLDIADSGQLLGRLGMPGVVRRGRGRLEGQVAWVGSPMSIDYPSMAGAFTVGIESGQFLKAEPGLAKLLGVLSLQSLPRRLSLDFRDVFSEGFSFDSVRGDVTISQGVAATNNLQMKGLSAAVLMEGRADLARETQDLRVVVVPEINAGTASLAAAVINPAIGLGTFLAQLFLREPLMRAATQEFHVTGTWTDPAVARVRRGLLAPPTPSGSAQAEPAPPSSGTN